MCRSCSINHLRCPVVVSAPLFVVISSQDLTRTNEDETGERSVWRIIKGVFLAIDSFEVSDTIWEVCDQCIDLSIMAPSHDLKGKVGRKMTFRIRTPCRCGGI